MGFHSFLLRDILQKVIRANRRLSSKWNEELH